MIEKIAQAVKDNQLWVIAVAGVLTHFALRRDIKFFHHVLLLVIGAPVTVLLIAPALEDYGISDPWVKFLIFIISAWMYDIFGGLDKVFKAWRADPTDFIDRHRKKK